MFTDRYLKSLKPKQRAYREYEKGPLPGFCIQVTPKGVKTFALHFTHEGRRRFMRLGRYPDVSLQEARERAAAARREVDQGNNPTVAPVGASAARQRTGTVRDAVELYVEDMQQRGKTSHDMVLSSLKIHALPYIGDLLARDVRPGHVQQVLARVLASGVKREHNKIRARLHAVFRFAMHYDYDPRALLRHVRFGLQFNPVAAVPIDRAAESVRIERNLTFDEIREVWNFPGWHRLPHTALKMILAVGGLRPVEVLGMRRQELDMDALTFTVPPDRFKMRRYHVVPLGTVAVQLLAVSINPVLASDLVFPSVNSKGQIHPYRVDSLVQYLGRQWENRDKGQWPDGVERFTPYDLRRTWKTRTGEMGISKELRDRVQGHAMSDVSSVHYDRWDYLPEKRAVIEQWDAKLREVVGS